MNRPVFEVLKAAGWKRDRYCSPGGKLGRLVGDRRWQVDIYPDRLLFYSRLEEDPDRTWHRSTITKAVRAGALAQEDLTAIRLLGYSRRRAQG